MTIPHKGSRLLDVDGKAFRFLVKDLRGPTVSESGEPTQVRVTVQEDSDQPGRPLQFTWPYGHAVTPEDVRTAVRDGVKAGWDPASRGGVFLLPTA